MSRFKDTIVRRSGAARLKRRIYSYRGEPVATRYYLEEDKPGKRGVVSRTWFDDRGAAERALGTTAAGSRDAWWELGSLRRTTTRREPWRLR